MRRLFAIAFKNPLHRWLVALIIVAMCLLTIASQMEIFTLGVITQKGPDFFELFAPMKDGQLTPGESVSQELLNSRFDAIASSDTGVITRASAREFYTEHATRGFMERVVAFLERYFSFTKNLSHLALFVFLAALFKAITLFTHRFTTRLLAIRVSTDLRQQYFEHIQTLPMSFYQQYNMGSLSSRVVGDAALIAEALNACLVNYIQTPFILITTLSICFLTSWKLSLVIFFGSPIIIFPIVFIARRVKKIARQIQKNQETFTSVLLDFLGGIQTVKVFAMEDFSLRKYQERNEKMAALEVKSARYDLSSRPIVHTIGMMFLATTLLYGLYILHLDVSEVLFYCGMLYLFYEPIKKFAEENSHIQRGITAAERLFEVMDMKPDILDDPAAVHFDTLKDNISFENVSFRYGDQWVLKDLSFSIKKGESVAIVGATGAGKSTIAQLLPRLFDVQEGEILLDGKSLKTYTQKSIREAIAYVPQRPFLFIDTIAQNIAFGRDFTKEQIEAAAVKAHADEFIVKLPEGYQSVISEGGKNLSGGQQQRLAIARALVKNAPVLILDEATSSLDSISENYIQSAVKELHGSVTQIVIAHRLSTIEYVDKIIYIENGTKIAEGTREELLRTCPPFKQMYEMFSRDKGL
jgi:ABC-type multidrug transport system fused ATPase/permease subunit